ncbi:MAG TPA: MFS transporter, partial [Solirubrobacteraceae bacterium]|nr:MFS transporter [Solirubrobacteraceae bacterium]
SVALIGLVREHPPPPDQIEKAKREPLFAVSPRVLPARYWRVVAVVGLFGLVNFSDAFIILRASDLGLGFVSIILAYVLYNIVYAGLSYPAGSLSDRIPRRLVYATGLAIFAIAYVGLGVADSQAWVWVLLPLYGAYTALTDGVAKAWIADLLPAPVMGTGLGLFQGITGGCALIAGIWAGLAWGHDGSTPLIVAGAVAAVAAVGVATARNT